MGRVHQGIMLSLLGAVAFSTTAIFTKVAYAAGVGMIALLVGRTLIAASLYWTLAAGMRVPFPARRTLVVIVLIGLVSSTAQLILYAGALQRIDASLASVLFFLNPAMVMAGAVLIGRERVTGRRIVALAVALLGTGLVLSGAGDMSWDGAGIALALGAALAYTIWVLTAHSLLRKLAPLALATLTSTGAALALTAIGLASGRLDFSFQPWGWLPIAGLAVCSTVLGGLANYGGLVRVGPTTNSILLAAEPPITVLLAILVLGERLRPAQLAGMLLVVGAVLLVRQPSQATR